MTCRNCEKEVPEGDPFCYRPCHEAYKQCRKLAPGLHSIRCLSSREDQERGDEQRARIKAIAEQLRGSIEGVKCLGCGAEAQMRDGTWVWGRPGQSYRCGSANEAWFHVCPGAKALVQEVKQ